MTRRAISAAAALALGGAGLWAGFAPSLAHAQAAADTAPGDERGPESAELARRIEAVLAKERDHIGDARVGIAVIDLGGDRVLYEREADGRFAVASNAKIVTAAAALAELGPDFRFRTAVYADSVDDQGRVTGDLTIRSTGDPSLGTAELRALISEIELAGITGVEGHIVVDDSYFDDEHTPPRFDEYEEPADEHASYRAPIGASSLNFNMIAIAVTPSPSGAGAASVTVDPPTDYAEVRDSVVTVERGSTRIRVDTEVVGETLRFVVTGQIRASERMRRVRRRVSHPASYLGGTVRALLAERGISVEGREVRRGQVPRGAVMLAQRQSPPLSVLVRGLGKYSNNYVAEMLLKSLGAEALGGQRPATWDDGLAVAHRFLEERVGLAPGGYRFENGSGLFDANEFSPRDIASVLTAARRDYRYGPELAASLAVAGADGTMRHRLRRDPAAGLVRAKTGTLMNVSALSGYAAIDGRAPLAFAILMDDVPRRGRAEARALQDELASALIAYLQSGP